MSGRSPFASIDEAVSDLKEGKFIVVVDDEDRETEGDLVIAAEKCPPEMINVMVTHARGVVCLSLTRERCRQLNLPPSRSARRPSSSWPGRAGG